MEKNNNPQEIKVELSPEVAAGQYSNRAFISHGAGEFFFDFISLTPNMPHAKVLSRIVMTPENAKIFCSLSATTFSAMNRLSEKSSPHVPSILPQAMAVSPILSKHK